jgi:MFS family permease
MGQGAAGISATAYIQAAAFAGIFIGGFWADFWSRSNVRGRVLVVMIGLLIAGPALFMATSTSLFLIAIIGLILYGLSRGLSDCNMMPILCQVADPRCRATGYGIMNFCSCMAGGVMIYVGGLLRDRQAELGASMQAELGRIFQYSAVGMFIAGALLILIWPRREVENA